MSDELKTVNNILDKSEDMVFDREYNILKLDHVIPHTDCGMVKDHKINDRITKDHMVFFKNRYEAEKSQDALDNGKTVFVGLKEVDKKWFVIKKEIQTPNVEIPETTLEEQYQEAMDLGNDY